MGFRVRKSINLGGGFRVNLSKSGIGYSWGVKGYRVTKTAAGRTRRTVSIPGTGISYVDESSGRPSVLNHRQVGSQAEANNYGSVQTVSTVGVDSVRSAEYDDLFRRVKGIKLLNVAVIVGIVICVAYAPVAAFLLALLWIALRLFGNVNISYNFDDYSRENWDRMSAAWRSVFSSEYVWQIDTTADIKNKRTAGGATSAFGRFPAKCSGKLPWYIKSSEAPIVLKIKGGWMAFMPDRLLLFDKKKFGAISYEELKASFSAVGFVESESVPKDAEVVKYTWLKVNNDGSPDRRYNGNRELPVMKYGRLCLSSASGMDIRLMFSNEAAVEKLYSSVKADIPGAVME